MDEEARRLMIKARTHMILRYPFWGYLSLCLELQESEKCSTMGTDGLVLFYNPDWIKKMNVGGFLPPIIAHEAFHAAWGHTWRRGARNPEVWNIAADAITNDHLSRDGLKFPSEGVFMNNVGKLSVEELYNKLLQNAVKVDGKVIDDHGSWNDDTEGEGEGSRDKYKKGKAGEDSQSGSKVTSVDDIIKPLTSKSAAQKALADLWEQRLLEAQQTVKERGQGAGSCEEDINELIQPKIDWKDKLRNAVVSIVKNNYRLFPANKKHLWRGMYLPSLYGDEIELAFCADTSGSMSMEEITEALSEVKGICDQFNNYAIHFMQADATVQSYQMLTPWNFEFSKKVRGRGGTDFGPTFDYIEENRFAPAILIYFTDGYGGFPEKQPPYQVLWILSKQGCEEGSEYYKNMQKFGQIIRYGE